MISRSGVGFTKFAFTKFLLKQNFKLAKVQVTFFKSHSYSTCVITAELQWYHPVLEIPTGPPVRGRQLWRRTGNFLLIFLWFYVYDLRFKAWGPTTFLTEFPTLISPFLFLTMTTTHLIWWLSLQRLLPPHWKPLHVSVFALQFSADIYIYQFPCYSPADFIIYQH